MNGVRMSPMTTKVNLICLPFSGGSVYSYKSFERHMPPFLRLIPVELPGRGQRVREKLLKNMQLMIDDIFSRVEPFIKSPYAIYGHSMGSLMGYLLTKRILQEGKPAPMHLFFTGCKAPSAPDREKARYLLPSQQFLEEIKGMGGDMNSVLNDAVTAQFFEPILRADFEATETYSYVPAIPFDIPITIANGSEEKITREEAAAWQVETTKGIEVHILPGDHFFIFQNEPALLHLITSTVKHQLNSSANGRNIKILEA
jgi:surfactin synthase thioesterase subunit